MKIKLYLSALFLCILFSCNKQDNHQANCDKTVASIAGTYSWARFEVGSSGVFKDVTSEVEPCQLDNKLFLNKDGSYVNQDVGIVCSYTGGFGATWSISPTGQMTIKDDNSDPTDYITFDITSFDCSTLVLTSLPDPNYPKEPVSRFTWKK